MASSSKKAVPSDPLGSSSHMEAENDDSPIDLEEASTEVDAQPNKQRKMSDLDTPRRRGNLTLKGLLPMPVNLASRKRKEEARLRKMMAKNEAETCSDEEKSYIKTLRERALLSEAERQEAIILRNAWEQRRINSMFFQGARKSQDKQEDEVRYQQLIVTDLWLPSSEFRKPTGVPMERIHAEALSSPTLTEYPAYRLLQGRSTHGLGNLGLPPKMAAKEGVFIPDVREVDDYEEGWDEGVTQEYNAAFKAGYIKEQVKEVPEPVESEETSFASPRRGRSATLPVTPATSHIQGRTRSALRNSATNPTRHAISSRAGLTSPRTRLHDGRGRRGGAHSMPATPLAASLDTPNVQTSPHVVRSRRAMQYFHPTMWTVPELYFTAALVKVLGKQWDTISAFMGGIKSPACLEKTWNRCDGDIAKIETISLDQLKCDGCHEESQLAELVYCSSCYRSYHLRCTYPLLDRVPESDWFCSATCSQLGTLNCKMCGKSTDDHQILVCDRCERGAHMYCLATPLTDVPEGDWFCDECASAAAAANKSKHRAFALSSSSSLHDSRQLEPRARDTRKASQNCDHPTGMRSTRDVDGKLPTLRDLKLTTEEEPLTPLMALLLNHAVEIPWRDFAYLASLCVDCIIEADGGVIQMNLAEFAPGHILLPASFAFSVFASQLDDVPFTSLGDVPDAASVNAHFDNLIAAANIFVDRAIANPLFSHKAPENFMPQSAASMSTLNLLAMPKPLTTLRTNSSGPRSTRKSLLNPHASPRALSTSPYPLRHSASAAAARLSLSPTKQRRNPPKVSASATLAEWLVEGGYEPTDHCYWIFQANPTYYDITTSLKNLKAMTWVVRQNQSRIRNGDRVFIWEAGKDAGVIALGQITSDPTPMRELPVMRQYAKDYTRFDRTDLRCTLNIEHILPSKYSRNSIAAIHGMSNLTILRAPIGTNFKMTKSEARILSQRLLDLDPSNHFHNPFPVVTVPEISAKSVKLANSKKEEAKNAASSATATATSLSTPAAALGTTEVEAPAQANHAVKIDEATPKIEESTVPQPKLEEASSPENAPSKMVIDTAPAPATELTSSSMDIDQHDDEIRKAQLLKVQPLAHTSDGENEESEEYHTGMDSDGEQQPVDDQTTDSAIDEDAISDDDHDEEDSEMTDDQDSDASGEIDMDHDDFDGRDDVSHAMDVDCDVAAEKPIHSSMDATSQLVESPATAESSVDTATTTSAAMPGLAMDLVPTTNAPLAPELMLKFSKAFVASCLDNTKRMRLTSGHASSALLAVSGGKYLQHHMSRIPVVPIPHVSPVQTFVVASTTSPKRYTIKIAPPQLYEATPSCPTCSLALSKPNAIACNKCGTIYHQQCTGKKSSAASTASPSATPPAWTCPSCVNPGNCVKCHRAARNDVLQCDCCDKVYHATCARKPSAASNAPAPAAPESDAWLCHSCSLNKHALMRIKLIFVLRELRLEAHRLIMSALDITYHRLRKTSSSPDKYGNPLDSLPVLTSNINHAATIIAQQATERWEKFRASATLPFD